MQTPHSRRFSRLRNLAEDSRTTAIREAVRKCQATGRARAHVMAGEYRWPEHFVSLLDDMVLHGASQDDLIAVGDAMREAALATALAGNAAPSESLGEVLALEGVAEAEANRDTAKLIDAPQCPTRKRQLLGSLRFHIARADRAVRVLVRDLSNTAGAAR